MADPKHDIRRRSGFITAGIFALALLVMLIALVALFLLQANSMEVSKETSNTREYQTKTSTTISGTTTSQAATSFESAKPTTIRPSSATATEVTERPTTSVNSTFHLIISEVCSVDPHKSGEGDWIELWNRGLEPVDLSGWHLTDKNGYPEKWPLPSVILQPGRYLVMDDSDLEDEMPRLGVSASGETLTLFDAHGRRVDVLTIGPTRPGITAGRKESDRSDMVVYFTEPTPGRANLASFATGIAVAPIMFGASGLYHSEGFWLTLTSPTLQATIHYTLDGSTPTSKSTAYTAPIWIDKNTVISAITTANGLLDSECRTATYLFVKPHTVPVVCLTGNPSEMTDVFERGSRYYKPEYAVSVEYFEPDGRLGVSFSAGVTPKGRSSLDLAQKSVTLKLRGAYGDPQVDYPFFPDSEVTTFSAMSLRNGGQDLPDARLRNSLFQKLSNGLAVDSIHTRPAVLYVNGRYWGLYDLDEEQEEGYFKAYFDADEETIELVDRNTTVIMGSSAEYVRVRRYAKNWDLADDAVFAQFAERVDIDACIDYLVANIYFGNGDMLNQRFWRTTDYAVRWRPLLFDLDWSMRFNDANRNKFALYFSPDGSLAGNMSITYVDIFYGLKKNKAWRNQFIDRFLEIAYNEYDTDRVLQVFDETVSQMSPEMNRQIARWGMPSSMSHWNRETAALRTALARRRAIVIDQLKSYFGLSSQDIKARVESAKK